MKALMCGCTCPQGYIGFTQGYLAELGSEHPVSLIQAMWAVQQLGQAEGYVPPELWVRDATRPLLQQLQALQKSHAPMVCILLASLHRYLVSTTPPSDSSQPVNPYADTAAAGAYGQELCQAALQAATLWVREDLSNTMHAETDPSVLQTSLQALVALQQAGRPNLVPKPAWFVLCCNALTQAVSQPRYANTGFVLTATQSLLALQRMRDEYKPQQSIVRFVNTDAHTKLLLPRDQAVQVQPSSKGAATGISYETLSELLTGFMSGRIAMPSRLVNALLKKSKSQVGLDAKLHPYHHSRIQSVPSARMLSSVVSLITSVVPCLMLLHSRSEAHVWSYQRILLVHACRVSSPT